MGDYEKEYVDDSFDMGEVEELGIGQVERVTSHYKPKVTRVKKPKKVDKLNFRKSFESIREVID